MLIKRIGVGLFIVGLLLLNTAPAITQSFIGLIATDKLLGRDSAGTGQVESLDVSEGIAFTGSGGIKFDVTSGSTESNIESAIDTLANLTSVQGFTVTLSDPNADAFFGWDDSLGAWEALTATEGLEIIKTVDGSGSGLDADLLDGVSSAGFLQDFNFTDDASTAGLAITEAETMTFAGDTAGIDTAGSGNTLTVSFDVTEAEANIESAIDTLANLTSIQGVSFTFGSYAATLLNTSSEATFKAAVNLEIGTDVQAFDADLTTLSTAFTTASASGAASLALHEDTDNGTNRVLLQGPASTADVTLTLQSTAGTIYSTDGTDVALADGGTGASLTDPNADRIMWWDDSDGAIELSSLLDLATEATPASGDYILFVDAAGILAKVDWSNVGAGGGANTALSNLAAVAINTSLISDTDSTDNLGSSSIAWASLFVDNVEFGAATTDTLNCASGECTIEGDKLKQAGKQTIWVPAAAMTPRVTAGCVPASREVNSITIKTCDFPDAADSGALFSVGLPKSWNAGTLTFQYAWTASAATATETTAMEMSCGSFANDAAINSTGLGTAVEVQDAVLAANDVHISAESSAITVSNAADDTVTWCLILRDTSEDTHNDDDIELLGVRVFYTDNAANDD
jgi:hypothetical protein